MIYVGSKARLAKYIVPILQNIINNEKPRNYVEPFVGGANIIDKIHHSAKYGFDNHGGLISIYNAVQCGWTPPLHIDEQMYLDARNGLKIGRAHV